MADTIGVDAIVIGKRCRRSTGELADLKASLEAVGMLHPIVISPSRKLLAGGRRLAAAKELGWDCVPVRIVGNGDELATALRIESDENTCRRDISPLDAVAMFDALEEFCKEDAKKRQQRSRCKVGEDSASSDKKPEQNGQARDMAAAPTGKSYTTIKKVKDVVAAVESGQAPTDLLIDLEDPDCNVSAVHRAAFPKEKEEKADPTPLQHLRNWIKMVNGTPLQIDNNGGFEEYLSGPEFNRKTANALRLEIESIRDTLDRFLEALSNV